MDGQESFTAFGQALDAAVEKRVQSESSQSTPTSSTAGENGGNPSHTPDEGTSSTSSGKSGTSNPTNGDTAGQTTSTKAANQGGENAGRTVNFHSAARRIRQRENAGRVAERISKLARERQELLNSGDEQSVILAHQKGSEIENLQALQADQEYQDWAERAYDCFGQEAESFLERSERYGAYVNQCEPGLVTMIERPYGLVLYNDWMRQMENGDFRNRWVGMTQFEKEAVLNHVYSQILAKANGASAGQGAGQTVPPVQSAPQQPQQVKAANVPVPGSGRESNQIPSPGSFGEALDNALAKRGISHV